MFLTNLINEKLINYLNNDESILKLTSGMYKLHFEKRCEVIDYEAIKKSNEIVDKIFLNKITDIFKFNDKLRDISKLYSSHGLYINIFIDLDIKNILKDTNILTSNNINLFTDKIVNLNLTNYNFKSKLIDIKDIKLSYTDENFIKNGISLLLNNSASKLLYSDFFDTNIIIDNNNQVIDGNYKCLLYKLINNKLLIDVYQLDILINKPTIPKTILEQSSTASPSNFKIFDIYNMIKKSSNITEIYGKLTNYKNNENDETKTLDDMVNEILQIFKNRII